MIDFSAEIHYKTARSGGKGGQNVNKVETMVEARWLVAASALLDPEQIGRLLSKLDQYISKEGYIQVQCSATRSQLENKALARKKLLEWVNHALIVPKKRKISRIPKSVIEKRLQGKRINAEKKANRRKDFE